MNIEHVAVYVNDLEAEKNFFVKYFGAKAGSKYSNFRNDFSNYFLKFDGGSRLEIMTRTSMADPDKPKYRSGYHPRGRPATATMKASYSTPKATKLNLSRATPDNATRSSW